MPFAQQAEPLPGAIRALATLWNGAPTIDLRACPRRPRDASEESVDVIAEPGSRHRRTTVRALVAAVAGTTLLAGCAAGQVVQTARQTPAVDGVNANVGSLALRAVTVGSSFTGNWAKGTDAPLMLVIASSANADDMLTSVSTDAAQSVVLTPDVHAAQAAPAASSVSSATPSASGSASGSASSASGSASGSAASEPIQIPALNSTAIGYGSDTPTITLHGLKNDLFPAQTITVTFTFATAGAVTFPVSVRLAPPPSNRPSLDITPTGE